MSNGDGLQQMLRLVNTFLNRPDTLAFRSPVDPKAMNIPDYFQIVKNPMDLGTVSALCAADWTTFANVMDEPQVSFRCRFPDCTSTPHVRYLIRI